MCECACLCVCVCACMNNVYGVECSQLQTIISEFAESSIFYYAFRYDRILRCTGFKVQEENADCVIPTMYMYIRHSSYV